MRGVLNPLLHAALKASMSYIYNVAINFVDRRFCATNLTTTTTRSTTLRVLYGHGLNYFIRWMNLTIEGLAILLPFDIDIE